MFIMHLFRNNNFVYLYALSLLQLCNISYRRLTTTFSQVTSCCIPKLNEQHGQHLTQKPRSLIWPFPLPLPSQSPSSTKLCSVFPTRRISHFSPVTLWCLCIEHRSLQCELLVQVSHSSSCLLSQIHCPLYSQDDSFQ